MGKKEDLTIDFSYLGSDISQDGLSGFETLAIKLQHQVEEEDSIEDILALVLNHLDQEIEINEELDVDNEEFLNLKDKVASINPSKREIFLNKVKQAVQESISKDLS